MVYYVLSIIFGVAFVSETMVSGKFFLHRGALDISSFMKWSGSVILALISVMNIIGFLRLRQNYINNAVDFGNYVQAMFAFTTACGVIWLGWYLLTNAQDKS